MVVALDLMLGISELWIHSLLSVLDVDHYSVFTLEVDTTFSWLGVYVPWESEHLCEHKFTDGPLDVDQCRILSGEDLLGYAVGDIPGPPELPDTCGKCQLILCQIDGQ